MRTEWPPPCFDFWFSLSSHFSLSLEPEIKNLIGIFFFFFIKTRNKINIVTETLHQFHTYIQYNHIWTTWRVKLCTAKLFFFLFCFVFLPLTGWTESWTKLWLLYDPHSQLSMLPFTYSIKAMASRQSKKAPNSVLRWGPLVAKLGTFSVPFSHRQEEVMVALQHSSWHGGVVDCLHGVSAEQLMAQPAVHFMSEPTISFFSCKGKKKKWSRKNSGGPISGIKSLNVRLRFCFKPSGVCVPVGHLTWFVLYHVEKRRGNCV